MTLAITLNTPTGNPAVPLQPRIVTRGLAAAFSLHPELIGRGDMSGNRGMLTKFGAPTATDYGSIVNSQNGFTTPFAEQPSQTILALARPSQLIAPALAGPYAVGNYDPDNTRGTALYFQESNPPTGTPYYRPRSAFYLRNATNNAFQGQEVDPTQYLPYSDRSRFLWICLVIDADNNLARAYFPGLQDTPYVFSDQANSFFASRYLAKPNGTPMYYSIGVGDSDFCEVVDFKAWNVALTDVEVMRQLANDRALYANLQAPITTF